MSAAARPDPMLEAADTLERAVLGSCLLDPDVLPLVRSEVTAEQFYLPHHRTIFTAICALADRGAPVELALLVDELRRVNQLLAVGGVVYLGSLELAAMSSGAAPEQAAAIADSHNQRHARQVLAETFRTIEPNASAAEIVAHTQARLAQVHTTSRARFERSAPAPLAERAVQALPAFPLEALPFWMRGFIPDVADSTQTSPDMAAMLALGVLSVALGGKLEVHARARFFEPVNLFVLVAADSSDRKGPVFKDLLRPIFQYEKEQRRAHSVAAEEAKAQLKILKREHASLLTPASQGDEASIARVRFLESEITRLQPKPTPQLTVMDTTPEALATAMNANGGRAALVDSEGGVFQTIMGRYSNGMPNIDLILKGYSNEHVRVNREKRPDPIIIDRPTLSMVLTVQHSVVKSLNAKEGMEDRGFLARFCYCFPPSMVGSRGRPDHPAPSKDMTETYLANVLTLCRITMEGAESDDPKPHVLKFSQGAQQLFDAYEWHELEPQLAPSTGGLYAIKSWAGKSHGLAARIAGLLHAARYVGYDCWHRPIDVETMEGALAIVRYLTRHAEAAYRMMGAERHDCVRDARKLVGWMIETGERSFTLRRIQRTAQHWFDAQRRDAALGLLLDRGYVSIEEEQKNPFPRSKGGRPKGSSYLLNDLARESFSEYEGDLR